ncbi:hypothetical protein [Terrisporobacter hibernicus]|uniref:Uncharacterized protein n=1 Tax=Terrisporobacter hibernicus TaxID=2813371 RepID=A0AAX2ZGB0_9FIRM|nr:hypothetical protein [Terrisporobacter hibernicus]UEL48096.1 hypothetical protein JW646_01195 [Terrisporobacter hibernicus]
MIKRKFGNVIYLKNKKGNSMELRCSNCNVVKNEGEITVEVDKETGFKKYKCENCGSSTFTPQIDLEEYYI